MGRTDLGTGEERQAWRSLHLCGDVDSIPLNARVPFVSGETEASDLFTVDNAGRGRPTEVLQTPTGRQPCWSQAISPLLGLLLSQMDEQAADFSDSFGKFQQHPHLRRSGLHWAGSEDHASIGLEKRAGKF